LEKKTQENPKKAQSGFDLHSQGTAERHSISGGIDHGQTATIENAATCPKAGKEKKIKGMM